MLEALAEGVGQRDDVDVESLVDLVRVHLVRREPVRRHVGAVRVEDLVGGFEEQQVAAVRADEVLAEHRLRRQGLERALGGTDEDLSHAAKDNGSPGPAALQPSASIAPSCDRMRAVAPHTDSPSISYDAVAEGPIADRPFDDDDRRTRQESRHRGFDDACDLGRRGCSRGRRVGDGDHRRHREIADRDPVRRERSDHANAGLDRVEPDLLGRLAQGGRRGVGVLGLGLAARETHLAAVVPCRRWSAR